MAHDKWRDFTVKMPPEDFERYDKVCDTYSGTARKILLSWVDAVEDNGLHEDMESLELAILKSYKNAIQKNIYTLETQVDKLDKRIEEMEEDSSGEVLFEIDLKMKQSYL